MGISIGDDTKGPPLSSRLPPPQADAAAAASSTRRLHHRHHQNPAASSSSSSSAAVSGHSTSASRNSAALTSSPVETVEGLERKKPSSYDTPDDGRALLGVKAVELDEEAAGSLPLNADGSHEESTTTSSSYSYSGDGGCGVPGHGHRTSASWNSSIRRFGNWGRGTQLR